MGIVKVFVPHNSNNQLSMHLPKHRTTILKTKISKGRSTCTINTMDSREIRGEENPEGQMEIVATLAVDTELLVVVDSEEMDTSLFRALQAGQMQTGIQ